MRSPGRPTGGGRSPRRPTNSRLAGRESISSGVSRGPMRGFALSLTAAVCLCACGHHRTPAEEALLRRGDCGELLHAADEARALSEPALAKDLADGCPQDRLLALVVRVPPEEGLLLCGRARAADAK